MPQPQHYDEHCPQNALQHLPIAIIRKSAMIPATVVMVSVVSCSRVVCSSFVILFLNSTPNNSLQYNMIVWVEAVSEDAANADKSGVEEEEVLEDDDEEDDEEEDEAPEALVAAAAAAAVSSWYFDSNHGST